jgi:phage regulator Rha-like protein
MSNKIAIPDEIVKQKIFTIRGKNVMLDRDLSELYEVENKRLKEQVRRNIDRFPEDFMIELTEEEYRELKELTGKQSRGRHSKYPPFAFTEHGVLMLASVLNSERAIKINIQIIRVFNQMRTLLLTHQEIFRKLEELEQKGAERDDKIMLIFEYIKQFEEAKQQELEYRNRKRIGFKTPEE